MNLTEKESIKKRLKNIMRPYRKMNSKTIRELESIGLEVKQGKKHCKIYPKNKPNHCYFISKTASDRKTGANAATMMCHLWLEEA